MKKVLTMILICTMIMSIAIGCNRHEEQPEPIDGNENIVENEEVEEVEEVEEFQVKILRVMRRGSNTRPAQFDRHDPSPRARHGGA